MVIQGKNPAHEIPCSIEVLKSSLCDYNDAYISVRGDITIIGHHVTQVAFKSCAPFKKYITQIDKQMMLKVSCVNVQFDRIWLKVF